MQDPRPRSFVVRFLPTILAIVIGALAALLMAAKAHAQEVTPDPCAVAAAPTDSVGGAVAQLIGGADPLVSFLSSGFLSSAIVIGALMWLRRGIPSKYDPPGGATDTSRLWNMGTALGLGLLLGLATIAPAVPIPGRELVGPVLIVARLLGGFLCATAAVFGRDFYARGQGAAEERAERKRLTDPNLSPVPPADPPV